MERFIKNFQRVKKEVEDLGATGEQILVEFVKNYQNLKDEKSEFGLATIEVEITYSGKNIQIEAKTENQDIEIIGTTPKCFPMENDEKERKIVGQILVR